MNRVVTTAKGAHHGVPPVPPRRRRAASDPGRHRTTRAHAAGSTGAQTWLRQSPACIWVVVCKWTATGCCSHGPEPGKPVYATPGGGLRVPLDAIAKAFEGIANALPNSDDPKSREKFDTILDGVGMTAPDKQNLIGVLQAACAVASVIGSVVPGVATRSEELARARERLGVFVPA